MQDEQSSHIFLLYYIVSNKLKNFELHYYRLQVLNCNLVYIFMNIIREIKPEQRFASSHFFFYPYFLRDNVA